MEELQYISQLGIVGFIAYYIIKEVFVLLGKRNGNGVAKSDANQDVSIARIDERLKVIETNHLPHIQKNLEQYSKDLEEIKVGIAEIKIKLEEIIK